MKDVLHVAIGTVRLGRHLQFTPHWLFEVRQKYLQFSIPAIGASFRLTTRT